MVALDRPRVSGRSLDRTKVAGRSLDRTKVAERSLDRTKDGFARLYGGMDKGLLGLEWPGGSHARPRWPCSAMVEYYLIKEQEGRKRVPDDYISCVGLLAILRFGGISCVEKEEKSLQGIGGKGLEATSSSTDSPLAVPAHLKIWRKILISAVKLMTKENRLDIVPLKEFPLKENCDWTHHLIS
ncbi:hypothetical protein ACS0TY_032358 [Phlomoides rotata]